MLFYSSNGQQATTGEKSFKDYCPKSLEESIRKLITESLWVMYDQSYPGALLYKMHFTP